MTIDCPGAFLRACASDPVLMRLRGPLVEALVLIDPALYREHVTTDKKGEPILYVRMNKALYGLLKSALDFYNKLRGDLEENGFVVNPYDPCVANKIVNGKQMTVIWHVDDLKVSHMDPKENTKFANWMKELYGEKLTIHRGKIHDYLGMDMDWSTDGQVSISMIKYLYKILEDFLDNITKSSVTPAADYLFKIRENEEVKKLPEELAIAFHHTVAQLLFLSQRARRDAQLPVSFLTKRVKSPDRDDWNKLVRCLQYLKSTLHMKLTLKVDSLSILNWFIDSSHQIHDDCKGHTGAGLTLGKGAVLSKSGGQKGNTKSTAETELQGVSEYLSTVLWGKYFVGGGASRVLAGNARLHGRSGLQLGGRGGGP
jgi:hypothetical protein